MLQEPNTTETRVDSPAAAKPQVQNWGLRFSLRSLLVLMLAVAMFFAGRSSVLHQRSQAPPLAGVWQATLPSGFVQPVNLKDLGKGEFLFRSRADVFSGVYRWEDGHLVVVKPDDPRMAGLVWRWDGRQLTLVAEPPTRPTGASYVGTIVSVPPPMK
ncbi:MAG: hypothetical protein MUF06_10160 [Pirellulaceae bacterium]|jgi:hypothetical protein|nr:hypothetical protein [Pirellulaceae bacterium]